MRPFHVYLLRCSDGSYYAGHTDDLDLRLVQHQTAVDGYTGTRKPVELVWQGEFESREGALAFERQIKGWSRAKKQALIAGDWERVQTLARSAGARGLRQAQPERDEGQVEGNERQPERNERQPERDEGQVEGNERQVERNERQPERNEGQVEGNERQPERDERQTERDEGQVERNEIATKQSEGQANQGNFLPGPSPVRPEPVEGLTTASSDRPGLVDGLTQYILNGQGMTQRRAMAKAITLLESTRAEDRPLADGLLMALLPHTGKAFRLGLSGVPGVGKSTFIEALGLYLIANGHRVAVLTIDPSSTVSGGSILGDKTRMERLSMDERAFIRPSPSSGTLGGVADKTREALLVCEAAGYDLVIVETVGVGQSETAVADMTDLFVLMQLPNAGDDLQAIKKGVVERTDLVVINKADIDPDAATRARAMFTSTLRLLGQQGRPERAAHDTARWQPAVVQLSALKADGIEAFWAEVERFRSLQTNNGELPLRRQRQAQAWMWARIDAGLKHRFRDHPAVRAVLQSVTSEVLAGRLPASTAARQLLSLYQPSTEQAELHAVQAELHAVQAELVEALTSPSTSSGRTDGASSGRTDGASSGRTDGASSGQANASQQPNSH